jgi:glutamine synthetase
VKPLVEDLIATLGELDKANQYPDGVEGLELAEYARDHQLPAMAKVRDSADRLEKVVADDLWPLPKYSEILFIK